MSNTEAETVYSVSQKLDPCCILKYLQQIT